MIPDRNLSLSVLHQRLQYTSVGCILRSEETGKKTLGALHLKYIFYHYRVSRLSGHFAGSIDDTVPNVD